MLVGGLTACAGSTPHAQDPSANKVRSGASAVAETATEFAYDVRDLAVTVGHGARDVAVDIAHGAKQGAAKATAKDNAKE